MSPPKTHIGSYRIVRILGEGGMGTVYEGVDDEIQRRVAVKILHPEYARKPDIVKRFLNEARAVNVVSHPGLVQISECSQAEDGTVYLVMEYLDGETLRARMDKQPGGRLTEDQVVRFTWQLATALSAAHASGIVHRDLKPGNVMLVQDPTVLGGERVKLLDFGIAKLGQQLGRGDGLHTRTGVTMGTPLYMAPEQCLGAADVDGKADVYSLGVMMFEMLAGEPPFMADAALVLLNMHLSKAPPDLRTMAPSVSDSTAKLVQLMLSKAAVERPAMAEVVRILQSQVALLSKSATFEPEDEGQTRLLPRDSATLRPRGEKQAPQGSHRSLIAFIAKLGLPIVIISTVWALGHNQKKEPPRIPDGRKDTLSAPRSEISATPPIGSSPLRVLTIVNSHPIGATVVRVIDNKVLGVTPWRQEQPAQPSELALELRLSGYLPKSLTIRLDEDSTRTEVLTAESKPRKPQSLLRVTRAAAEKRQPSPSASKAVDPPKPIQEKSNDPVSRIID